MAPRNFAPIADPAISNAATNLANAYLGREMAIAKRRADQAKALEDLRRWQTEMGLKQKQFGLSEAAGEREIKRLAMDEALQPGKLENQQLQRDQLQQAIKFAKASEGRDVARFGQEKALWPDQTTLQGQQITQGEQNIAEAVRAAKDAEASFQATGRYTPIEKTQRITELANIIPSMKALVASDERYAPQLQSLQDEYDLLIGPKTEAQLRGQTYAEGTPEQRMQSVFGLGEGDVMEVVDPESGQRRTMTITEAEKLGLSAAPPRSQPGAGIRGASDKAQFTAIQESARLADTQNRQLENLQTLSESPDFNSGKISSATMGLKGWLGSLGLETEGYTEQQVFNAVAQNLALDRSGALTGPASDRDMQLIVEAGPAINQSPEAVQALIRLTKKTNDYNLLRGVLADEWVAQNQSLRGFDLAFQQMITDGDLAQDVWSAMKVDPNARTEIIGTFLGGQ